MPERPKQGDVWWASFYEGGERPAIVVSRNELNRGRLVLVVPCTSSRIEQRAAYSNHVLLPPHAGYLSGNTGGWLFDVVSIQIVVCGG